MALNLSLHQGMEQSLSLQLTPSQKLSLEILQLNIQNLEQRIAEEIETNPLIEVEENIREVEDVPSERVDDHEENRLDGDHREDVREYLESYYNENEFTPSTRVARDDDDNFVDSIPANEETLENYLREQIDFLRPRDELKDALFYLLSHLDARGYLPLSLEELAEPVDRDPIDHELLQEALTFIQERLDPPGIGARDLKECLILQLRHIGEDFKLEERIIREHFDDLLNNRLGVIADKLAVDLDTVKECVQMFRSLEFRPIREFDDSVTTALKPDALISYESPEDEGGKGRFTIKLVKSGQQELKVMSGTVYKSSQLTKEEKRFIMEKSQSGKALIEAIRRRNETLLIVINAICQRQESFFGKGRKDLQPLLMQDIAKDVGLSAATVTRTVKDKVVQTDDGIFPLKYFFSVKRVMTADGEEKDRNELLDTLKKIIDEEDKKKPLSDSAISKLLAEQGKQIATRTVSKYRDILNIPSSSKRKAY